MKKIVSLSLAAVMAVSSSICAYADVSEDSALKSALVSVKSRVDIPEELEEFNYRVSNRYGRDQFTFEWSTPAGAKEYKYVTATYCSPILTSYNAGGRSYVSSMDTGRSLAKLSSDELYEKAAEAVKQLNPTAYRNIQIERDSLNISLSGNTATFSVVRIANGIPVSNDRGSVSVDKNTGELISFHINWHMGAAFRRPASAIPEETAKEKYADMIGIKPQYEVYFDSEADEYKSRIVYVQSDYGEINAFTGNKSDFAADGYFEDNEDAAAPEAPDEDSATKGEVTFTPAELEELNKELPYGNEAAVIELISDNKYMSYNEDMVKGYSNMYKDRSDRYIYSISFTNDSSKYDETSYWDGSYYYEELYLSLDAESGELISYSYYTGDYKQSTSFDKAKNEKLAAEIAKEFAGEKLDEYKLERSSVSSYTDKTGVTYYSGSSYNWGRYVNDISVNGDDVNVRLDANGVLTSYSIGYSDVDFVSPKGMLSEDEIMEKFWQQSDLDLYYLARINDSRTKTVLVYGTDDTVYCDAFTGEQFYSYYTSDEAADLSGITDEKLHEKAEILSAHGLSLGSGRISASDKVSESIYANILNRITQIRLYSANGSLILSDGRAYTGSDKALNKGDAMIMLTAAECGTVAPQLAGIFKSPYTDISDSDKNVGYYAIAHALTGSKDTKLNAEADFTVGDMVELIYGYLTK